MKTLILLTTLTALNAYSFTQESCENSGNIYFENLLTKECLSMDRLKEEHCREAASLDSPYSGEETRQQLYNDCMENINN